MKRRSYFCWSVHDGRICSGWCRWAGFKRGHYLKATKSKLKSASRCWKVSSTCRKQLWHQMLTACSTCRNKAAAEKMDHERLQKHRLLKKLSLPSIAGARPSLTQALTLCWSLNRCGGSSKSFVDVWKVATAETLVLALPALLSK